MNTTILNTILLSLLFLALFGIAELLYHVFKIDAELTRKFVHVGTGLLTLLFPLMLNNQWFVLLLCSIFAVILIASLRFNLLPSINAINRPSVGSIAYPVAVYVCYLAYDHFGHQKIYFYLPVLILAICDPIAAIAGKKWPLGKFNVGKENKTIVGSSMFFISAFIITLILLRLLLNNISMLKIILSAILISLVATVAEALCKKGYDNIAIPLAVLISLTITQQLMQWL